MLLDVRARGMGSVWPECHCPTSVFLPPDQSSLRVSRVRNTKQSLAKATGYLGSPKRHHLGMLLRDCVQLTDWPWALAKNIGNCVGASAPQIKLSRPWPKIRCARRSNAVHLIAVFLFWLRPPHGAISDDLRVPPHPCTTISKTRVPHSMRAPRYSRRPQPFPATASRALRPDVSAYSPGLLFRLPIVLSFLDGLNSPRGSPGVWFVQITSGVI
jgi:hypothetical protein